MTMRSRPSRFASSRAWSAASNVSPKRETGLGRSEPEADREGRHGSVGRGWTRSCGSDALDDDDRVVEGAVRQDGDELLAAVARGDVVGADAVAQHSGEEPQGPVAGVMAVHVVEQLEMVEIAVRDDEREPVVGEITRALLRGCAG